MKLIIGKVASGKSQKVIDIAKEKAVEGKATLIVTSLADELGERFGAAKRELAEHKDNFMVTSIRPDTSSNPEMAVVKGMIPVFGAVPDVIIIHAEIFSRELVLALMNLEPVLKAEVYMVVQANSEFAPGVQVVDVEEVIN
ncbi:hypothetical protein SHANETTE_211 [Bacillus phage Shanette]|uniref:Uncharacterized protein n=1 Tax=Bacillus phage Shanette TaxID=1296656 RepID=S5M5A1_9CAUD|nr:replication protein [Bacillus phage Shanette]AGR47101.1 hypothetical protein SHANETTE_211 [Bacillus phage Shanette]